MAKNLVIVESPSKSKTIEKYLGSDYKVVSSKGHIRDLKKSGKYGLGIDTENNFEPSYEIIKGKNKVVADLKENVKKAGKVYLATDPDREGEAISWHLKDALKVSEDNYERIVFNEITKEAILDSFKTARKIDDDLVKSQETRRFLDRMIGFRLSKLMQSKTGGKSAGRVQSVALKLIVDLEKEINNFITEEYWTITANFPDFEADLYAYQNKNIEVKTEEEANNILDKLSKAFKIREVTQKEKNKQSRAPFITSTLQQEASTKLNFGAKRTMSIAQRLYEGVDLGDETVGLITYMRTDSIRLSNEFTKNAFAYIKKTYGEAYIGSIKKAKKKDNVQDAHEAIRPTNIKRTPESVKEYLTNDEYKLYEMIYFRTLASLMKDAKVNVVTAILDNNGYQFKATGQTLIFDGYLKVYKKFEKSEDKELPPLEKYKTDVITAKEIVKEQHFTMPPARYTEAKLIKEMEDLGIGRPSTYAKTVETLTERDYVKVIDKKFHPTEIGILITEQLQNFFSDLINVKYTAKMEDDLDKIAEGKLENIKLLGEFWNEFAPKVTEAFTNMEKKAPETTGEDCPECGSPLVKKKGKYGYFIACSNYPTCKYIKREPREVKEIRECPKCHQGMIIEKKTKKGKIFYGCNNYPKCDFATWDEVTKEDCPKCHQVLVKTKTGIKCSNCDYKKEV